MQYQDRSQEYTNLKTNKQSKYYYQIKLANDIKVKLLDSDQTAGMLVLPTGGGKTRVAVTTALDKAMKDGYKIFWIAHRHMLLDQAEQTFYEFSQLAGKDLSIKVISGKHGSIKSLSKDDDVVIMSNMSMGIQEKDEEGKDYDGLVRQTLKEVLFTKDQKWLIIVDEAHHSLARSYKQWINPKNGWLRRYRKDNIKILGLTATPNFISQNDTTIYDENRTKELSNIYDNNLIATISTQKLIDDKILSLPHFITIDTDVELDAEQVLGRVKNIKGSLKNVILEKELNEEIAKHVERNQLIVNTYLNGYKNIDFTKDSTLIFASNIINAITLKESFKKAGIVADVIYSNKSNNDQIIEDFRNKKFKVLINVEILTEGSDIPEIQNVFISKITGSKILYRQMVGRALRGVDSGGTKTANIVTFRDNIINYHKDFFNAQKLTQGLFAETSSSSTSKPTTTTEIDEGDIAKAYEKFFGLLEDGDQDIDLTSAIPIGYYDLDEIDKKLNVYEHQLDSYKSFLVAYRNNNELLEKNITDLKEHYFKSDDMIFDVTIEDLETLINYIKELKIIPEFIKFDIKQKIEDEIKSIALQYTDTIDFKKLEEDFYNSIYVVQFYEYEKFEEECLNLIKQFRHHQTKPTKTIQIKEEEYPEFTFDEALHDKEKIFANAKKEILRVLKKDELEKSPQGFEWTKKPYRSYYGMAYESTDGYSENSNGSRIEINKLLQLKEIPSKVIEFVVYHELLHTELENYSHDAEFKEYEAMYPEFVYCEQMLYKIANSNINNLLSTIYQSNYKVYEKDTIANQKKLIKNEELILLNDEELQELYQNKAFRDSLIADGKYWLLSDDLVRSMSLSDGKFHKVQNAYVVTKVNQQ
jgi:superfamily II DNA or RNA helicase/predicted metal-dependent hydrolase